MNALSRREALKVATIGTLFPALAVASTPVLSSSSSVFNVRDYGATGDGVTDDTPFVLAALAALQSAGRGVLYFPAGTYSLSVTLSLTNFFGALVGDGIEVSILLFKSCDGIYVNNSSWTGTVRPASAFHGLSFVCNTLGVHTAFRFHGPNTGILGKQISMRDCQFRGIDYGHSWRVGISLVTGAMSDFNGVYFIGHTSNPDYMQYGVHLTQDSTDVKIQGCYFYWVSTGVLVDGAAPFPGGGEGIIVSQTHFVPVNSGIVTSNIEGNYIVCTNCHISANLVGVSIGTAGINGANLCQINNNLIFNNNFVVINPNNYFIGINVQSARNCVSGNEVMMGDQSDACGIVLGAGANHCRVVGNHLSDHTTGVWLQAGSARNVVSANTSLNCYQNIFDQGNNNIVANNI